MSEELNTKSYDFLKPKYKGKRFDGHSIPVKMLKSLAAFEDLVIEAAAQDYLNANPKRFRVPSNFRKSLSVVLSDIHDGSAVAVLKVESQEGLLTDLSQRMHVQQGQRRVQDLLRAVGRKDANRLNEMGVETVHKELGWIVDVLQSDESIEFEDHITPGAPPIVFNMGTKDFLSKFQPIAAANEPNEAKFLGKMVKLDLLEKEFKLQKMDGTTVACELLPENLTLVSDAFKECIGGRFVEVAGQSVAENSSTADERMTEVTSFAVLPPRHFGARIAEIGQLEKGWHGEASAPFDGVVLAWLQNSLERYFTQEDQRPYMYPQADGTISLEWEYLDREVQLDVQLLQLTGDLYVLFNDESHKDYEQESINLNNDTEWVNVLRMLTQPASEFTRS